MRLPRPVFALASAALAALLMLTPACVHTKHEVTHKLEPIEVNVNVNVRVQIEEDLDAVFDDIDSASTTVADKS